METKTPIRTLFTLLILAIIVGAATMLNVPSITGQVVQETIDAKGVPAALMMVLIAAAVIGIIMHMSVSNLSSTATLENFAKISKYWQGIAIQKHKWSRKEKYKPHTEIKIETADTNTLPQNMVDKNKNKTDDLSQFGKLADEMGTVDVNFTNNVHQTVKQSIELPKETTVEKSGNLSSKLDVPNQDSAKNNPTIPKKQPTQKIKTTPNSPAQVATNMLQTRVTPRKKQQKDMAYQLMAKFGTKDPLAVAEAILKKKKRRL